MESKPELTSTAQLLHQWYLALPFKQRKQFSQLVFDTCMPDVKNKRAKIWNWLQGKATIPALAQPKVYEAILIIDPRVETPNEFNFKFYTTTKMENNIKKLLEDRNWTQQKLADETGLTRVGINLIINQAVEPGGYSMMRIAAAFDLSLEEVFPRMQVKKIA